MGLLFNIFYRKLFVHRYDDEHIIKYFSYHDFEGLNARPFDFKNYQENNIHGYFYSYPNYKKDHLVIFCHGISAGHTAYMHEIERIAKEGYEVLAYDNTGCFESEGKDIRGLSESLPLLECALNNLKESGYLKDKKVSLVGHSWGGYAVSNILNYFKDIYSITVISGFVSLPIISEYLYPKYKKPLISFEKKANPKYVYSSSLDALKDTKLKVLVIHSEDDQMVPINAGAKYLQDNLKNPNVKYLIVKNKMHNPNYTLDALTYMNESFSTYYRLQKEKKLKTFEEKKQYMDSLDWKRMTKQDEDIWKIILENIK